LLRVTHALFLPCCTRRNHEQRRVTNVPPSAAKFSAHRDFTCQKKRSCLSVEFSTWPVSLLQYQPRLCFQHIDPMSWSMSRGRGSGPRQNKNAHVKFPIWRAADATRKTRHVRFMQPKHTEKKKRFVVSEPTGACGICVCVYILMDVRVCACIKNQESECGGEKSKHVRRWRQMAWNPITRQSSGVAYETWNVRSLLRRRKMYAKVWNASVFAKHMLGHSQGLANNILVSGRAARSLAQTCLLWSL
jgi:hypothetical protein